MTGVVMGVVVKGDGGGDVSVVNCCVGGSDGCELNDSEGGGGGGGCTEGGGKVVRLFTSVFSSKISLRSFFLVGDSDWSVDC